ncbi:hypothetical protein CN645_16070 [Burkholderia sp. IDO3]|nr:hypothetical protein DCN14_16730 [Burkholderia sp. IDO3]PCD61007.1 hypothetical protein CN645_16070 [Burkholderia sp. IDO3]
MASTRRRSASRGGLSGTRSGGSEEEVRTLLQQRVLTQNMSRTGNCPDNTAMESFFGTLKSE